MSQQQYNDFDIPQEFTDRLNESMNLGGSIELPFPAPVFWWLNGNPQSKALAAQFPALYFGGWAANEEALMDVEQERGIPAGLTLTDIFTRSNKELKSYTGRSVIVAPIGVRSGWIIGEEGEATVHSVKFVEGRRNRRHVQMLVLLATKESKDAPFTPWGPAVLSAKGYNAGDLLNHIKDWQRMISPAIRKAAPNVPAWCFYMALGTFGQNPITQMAGKGNAKSPYTHVQLFQPPNKVDEQSLKKIYVGRDGVAQMVDYLDQAQPWLKAWETQQQNNGMNEPGFDNEFIPEYDPNLGDIPF